MRPRAWNVVQTKVAQTKGCGGPRAVFGWFRWEEWGLDER
jgi:hypothetical protein